MEPTARADVFYASLMRFAGCAATSHEAAAALGGDDVAVRSRGDLIDPTRPLEALRFLTGLGHGVDDTRILLFLVEAGKVRSVDQFIGDPTAVTAFWA